MFFAVSLFTGVLTHGPVPELVGDGAWVRAMLAAEAALARASAEVGMVPAHVAEAIAAARDDAATFDPAALGRDTAAAPAIRSCRSSAFSPSGYAR